MDPIFHKIARGTSIIFVFSLLAAPLGYVTKVLYSRTLSLEMFGLWSAVLAFIAIFESYNDLGYSFSLTYLVPKFAKKNRLTSISNVVAYSTIIQVGVSGILCAALVLFSSFLASHYFKHPLAQPLLFIFCIYLVASSLSAVFKRLFIGLQRESFYSSGQPLRLMFIVILSLIVWLVDLGNVTTYALVWSAAYVFLSLVYFSLLRRNYPKLIRKVTWDKKLFKHMTALAKPVFSTRLLHLFVGQIGVVLLTVFQPVEQVGAYSIILALASVAGLFLTPLNRLFLPLISELAETQRTKIKEVVELMLRVVPFGVQYFNFFVSLFAGFSISLLFGDKWVELARQPLIIMSAAYIFIILSGYLVSVVGGLGLLTERLKVLGVTAALNLVLSSILTFMYGLLGLAVATTIVNVIFVGLLLRLIARNIQFKIPYWLYAKIVVFSALTWLVVEMSGVKPSNLISYVVIGLGYTLLAGLFAVTQGVINRDGLLLLMNLAPRKLRLKLPMNY